MQFIPQSTDRYLVILGLELDPEFPLGMPDGFAKVVRIGDKLQGISIQGEPGPSYVIHKFNVQI